MNFGMRLWILDEVFTSFFLFLFLFPLFSTNFKIMIFWILEFGPWALRLHSMNVQRLQSLHFEWISTTQGLKLWTLSTNWVQLSSDSTHGVKAVVKPWIEFCYVCHLQWQWIGLHLNTCVGTSVWRCIGSFWRFHNAYCVTCNGRGLNRCVGTSVCRCQLEVSSGSALDAVQLNPPECLIFCHNTWL